MLSLEANYFALFDLPERFALAQEDLDSAYRAVQSEVHPDRFAAAGDAQRRIAMQWAARANEAYRTLKRPLDRAVYLLKLRGVDAGSETNTAMEPAFLMQQMEWREQIEDAAAARNLKTLESLAVELREDQRQRFDKLAALLDSGVDQGASEATRQLMFIERVAADIEQQIERLD